MEAACHHPALARSLSAPELSRHAPGPWRLRWSAAIMTGVFFSQYANPSLPHRRFTSSRPILPSSVKGLPEALSETQTGTVARKVTFMICLASAALRGFVQGACASHLASRLQSALWVQYPLVNRIAAARVGALDAPAFLLPDLVTSRGRMIKGPATSVHSISAGARRS